MGRALRVNSLTRAHNVGLKGHNSATIFYEEEDRKKFIKCLKDACEKFKIGLAGWVLMSNHVHILLHGDISNFSSVFQSIGASFARWYNRKYGRSGTLWNDRYYDKPISSRQQYLDTISYFYNNPVEAGLVKKPEQYKWSNYSDVIEGNDVSASTLIDEMVNVKYMKKYIASKLEVKLDKKTREFLENIPKNRISDECLLEEVKKVIKRATIAKIKCLPDKRQKKLVNKLMRFDTNINQISRVTGITRRQIQIWLC